ncbi:MAG: asparagine synthase (glutamine-hydrolyzing) [Gemmatimonadetes bacterium]|nr:MAG: asparagine synthase (glutamine-hydrolyzing) [Gemmatimonadota bacterium]
MCGFAGAFAADPTRPVDPASLRNALTRLTRRGPDGEGLHVAPGVALGHRRLAVLDPEGGRQPFVDTDTGVALVFNGEVYNHAELRARLRARGHRFRTRSDTEVLLRAYLEWGADAPEELVGMFAYAVFDPRAQELHLVRDRLGVKPLYFGAADGLLLFASSVPALRALPGVSGAVDLEAVSHYLMSVRTTLGARTLLRDVRALQPGEYLIARRGGEVRVHTYWTPPALAPGDKPAVGCDEARREVAERVEAAVRARLEADVPLGGFLSGGLDSAVVTALAAPAAPEPYRTFTIGAPLEGYNEFAEAAETAAFLGVPLERIELDERAWAEDWTFLIDEKGLPLSTPNEVGILRLARALRRHCVVALTGEAADEVFGGYALPHFSAYDCDRLTGRVPCSETAAEALRRAYGTPRMGSRLEHFLALNAWIPWPKRSALFTADARHALRGDAAVLGHYGDLLLRVHHCSTLDAYLHVHARVNLEGLLYRVDTSTMAASVEARVPFTDHRLVEYAFTLPDDLRIGFRSAAAARRGADLAVVDIEREGLLETKRVLRRAFADRLPPGVLERAKRSFPTPFQEWFAGGLAAAVRNAIEGSRLLGTVLDPGRVRALLPPEDGAPPDVGLWPLANLALWAERCGVSMP